MQRGRRGSPPRRTPEYEREDSSTRLTLSDPKTHSERGDSEKWRQGGEVVSGPEAEPRLGLGGAWGAGPASVLALPGSLKRGLFALCAAKRCVAGLPASPRKTGPGAIYNPTLLPWQGPGGCPRPLLSITGWACRQAHTGDRGTAHRSRGPTLFFWHRMREIQHFGGGIPVIRWRSLLPHQTETFHRKDFHGDEWTRR